MRPRAGNPWWNQWCRGTWIWPPLDRIAWLSPFYYFNPYELVGGGPLQVENLLVLGAIATTGYTVAYLVISQRDISR